MPTEKPTKKQSLRRYFICCTMYIEQKDYEGLLHHLLNGKDYLFFEFATYLVGLGKHDELLGFFNQKIEEYK